MRKAFNISAALVLALALNSCKFLKNNEEGAKGEPVARVYDSYLYKNDLEKIVPEELSGDDSLSFIQNYINVWAKNKLMVYKAEFNLTEEQKRFEEKIENYRSDLLKYAYLQKYVDDKLDTNISETDIRQYYSENQTNFQLKENILRLRYLVVPQDAPQVERVGALFNSQKTEDQKELKEYALSYARYFSTEDTSWISFNKFTELVPVQTFNQQEFLANNKQLEIKKDGLIYFVEIRDYKIKNSPSPLPYVYDLIENILLNRKRLALIENLEKNLLDDAIKKKEFETY